MHLKGLVPSPDCKGGGRGHEVGVCGRLHFVILFRFLSFSGAGMSEPATHPGLLIAFAKQVTWFLLHRSEMEGSFAASQVDQGLPYSCFRCWNLLNESRFST